LCLLYSRNRVVEVRIGEHSKRDNPVKYHMY